MLIEFTCNMPIEYDATLGRASICKNKIVVRDDQIGEMVACSRCGEMVEVPFENPTPQKNPPSTRDKSQPAVAATKTKQPKSARPPVENSTKTRSSKPNRLPQSSPIATSSTDVMGMDLSQASGQQLVRSSDNGCPKCGAPMNARGKCTQCRYVEQKFSSAYLPVDEINLQLAGFQKWFCETLSEGVSLKLVEAAMHALMGVFFIVLILACIVGGVLIGLVPVGLLLAFYVGMVVKGYDLRKNPRARLAWFQKPFWYGILALMRRQSWQKAKVVEKRNAPLSDDSFPEIEGVATAQVLDLQGTMITDQSLRKLYGHKYLKYLVVRGTKVTPEGVMRLQQANPRLWIWH